jgi:SAM-dependent methyltransferase
MKTSPMDSKDVRQRWAERSGEFSPEYYAHRGPDEASEAIRVLFGRFVGRGASVLELGCSSGRHLAHLQANGYDDLTGIELNADALSVMKESYPDLAAAGTFYAAAIEDVLDSFADGQFAAVYSVETLQHVHPDSEWVFAELARITDDLLITVENERREKGERSDADGSSGANASDSADGPADEDARSGETTGTEASDGRAEAVDVSYVDEGMPLYYRDWHRVFTDLGLVEVEAQSGTRDTLRAFRPAER